MISSNDWKVKNGHLKIPEAAEDGHYGGIAAITHNIEQILGLVLAAEKARPPLMLQFFSSYIKFSDGLLIGTAAEAAQQWEVEKDLALRLHGVLVQPNLTTPNINTTTMAMSSQPEGPSDECPPYRSFKELRDDPTVAVIFSPAARRLFWPLDGVFPITLSVMKTPRSANDLEPYFQQTPGGGAIWHEIAQLPLTEPKVSSVEVSVYDLEQWDFNWAAWHGHHEGEPANPEFVTYGDLSDDDRPYAAEAKEDGSWEGDEDTEFLVRCCGQDRPLGKRGQKLVVTPDAGDHFVTVHDYVSAVHPWLMGLRPEILLAKTVSQPQSYPRSAEMAWMVDKGPEHKLEEKQSWIQAHGGGPPRPVPASTAAILARIRASRNR